MSGTSTDFNAATRRFAYNVLEALGAERGAFGIGYAGVWNAEDFREVLGRHTPTQVLDAIATAEPAAAPFINVIRDNPELAQAFHERAVEDPEFLTNMATLSAGTGTGPNLTELASGPYGARLMEEITPQIEQLITNPDYTIEQFRADARPGVLRALTAHAATLEPSERLQFMRTELTALDPNMQSIFETLDAAPEEVRTAVGNAIAHNPAFSEYLAQRFGAEGGEASLAGIFTDLNGDRAGAVADIMNTIANGTGYQTVEDFQRLDRVLEAAQERTRLLNEIAERTEADPNADTRELTEQLSRTERELLMAARDAGADIPALAMLNQENMGQFFRDLFDPNSPDPARSALNNLALSLQLSGAELEQFNQLMGPLAQIMNFMFEPYAQLFQNHGASMGNGISNIMSGFESLVGRTPVSFQAPADPATSFAPGDFNDAWNDATAKTFDAVTAELERVDPLLVEELRAVRENPELRASFEHAVNSTATHEQLEAAARAFQAEIAGGATISRAIDAMAPSGGP